MALQRPRGMRVENASSNNTTSDISAHFSPVDGETLRESARAIRIGSVTETPHSHPEGKPRTQANAAAALDIGEPTRPSIWARMPELPKRDDAVPSGSNNRGSTFNNAAARSSLCSTHSIIGSIVRDGKMAPAAETVVDMESTTSVISRRYAEELKLPIVSDGMSQPLSPRTVAGHTYQRVGTVIIRWNPSDSRSGTRRRDLLVECDVYEGEGPRLALGLARYEALRLAARERDAMLDVE